MDVSSLFSADDNEIVDLQQNYDFNEDFSTPSVVNTQELRDSIVLYNKHRTFIRITILSIEMLLIKTIKLRCL